ncbi:hypothetical protein EDB80DRAFT_679605 [Ilyonectria destructans]|nr:hypothetical protein EDB80DRAFT_679605 [Ilyonectria destructans]
MKSCLQRPRLGNVTKTTPIRSGRVSLPYAIPRCSRGFWRDRIPPSSPSVDNRATTAEINNKIQRTSVASPASSSVAGAAQQSTLAAHLHSTFSDSVLRTHQGPISRIRGGLAFAGASQPWWPQTFLSRLATAAARTRRTPGLGGKKRGRGANVTGYWASLWLHERRIVLVAALTRQATLRLLESFWGLVCRVDCQRATGYLSHYVQGLGLKSVQYPETRDSDIDIRT